MSPPTFPPTLPVTDINLSIIGFILLMVRLFYIAAVIATLASLRAKKVGQFPFFMAYLVTCGLASISYAWGFSPTASESWWRWHWLLWQPFLAITLLAAVGELAWWVMLKVPLADRTNLLLSMTWLAVGLTCVATVSLPSRDNIIYLAADMRHMLDLGVAVWLAVGWACLNAYGRDLDLYMGDVDAHGTILTIFCVMHAAIQQLAPTWPTFSQFLAIDTVSYLLSSLCLLAWSLGLHGESHPTPAPGRLVA